jgi:sporulation protein YlmC with PRC-barrel domain
MTRSATDFKAGDGPAPDLKGGVNLLSAGTITGNEVWNRKEEKLGSIKEIMLDIDTGKIRYVVLSAGGFLGMGDHLFAVPWSAFKLDTKQRRFLLDVDVERIKAAPGFDKDEWPNMADATWSTTIESYYAPRSDHPRG